MANKILNFKCDYWGHPELSRKVLNRVIIHQNAETDSGVYCIPNMEKPYFWEVWKFGPYKRECDRILREVDNTLWENKVQKWEERADKHAIKDFKNDEK
jgi:hypothetical protein